MSKKPKTAVKDYKSKLQLYQEYLDEIFPEIYANRKVSTACTTIDELMGGGIPRKRVSGVFSERDKGKTWLAKQAACAFLADEENHEYLPDTDEDDKSDEPVSVMYVDTEGFWDKPEIELFGEFFKKRFKTPKGFEFNIKFVSLMDIYRLYEFFGMQAITRMSGEKFMARVVYKRDDEVLQEYTDRANRKRQKVVNLGEINHLLASPAWTFIESENVGMVIVDSVTMPIKEQVPTSSQSSFPGRANLMNPFLGTLRSLAIVKDIPVFTTWHLTKGKAGQFLSPRYGTPWGGDDVMFHIKNMISILQPNDKEQKGFKDHEKQFIRTIKRFRVPGRLEKYNQVFLSEDYGFEDLYGSREREGEA
jgi:RecA/RadA recombinase